MARIINAKPHYRPKSSGEPGDDRLAIYEQTLVVADGCAEPHRKGIVPALVYPGGENGGQVAAETLTILAYGTGVMTATGLVRRANRAVAAQHLLMGKDPNREVTGGATFAVVHCMDDVLDLCYGGDCWIFLETLRGLVSMSGFDEAADQLEETANQHFDRILKGTKTSEFPDGDLEEAWRRYLPLFRDRKWQYTNREMGFGGSAEVNGADALEDCWGLETIDAAYGVSRGLICTDGLLHRHFKPTNTRELWDVYSAGGVEALYRWRDEKVGQYSHLPKGHHPEASAIEFEVEN